jgi:hypothetical protein
MTPDNVPITSNPCLYNKLLVALGTQPIQVAIRPACVLFHLFAFEQRVPADYTMVVRPPILNQVNFVGIKLLADILTGPSALPVDERGSRLPALPGPRLLATPVDILLNIGQLPFVPVKDDCFRH